MVSQHNDKKVRQKYNELVSSIYAGALNPSDYNVLFKAWDEHFEANVKPEDFDWAEDSISHFEQADQFLEKLVTTKNWPLSARIHEMPVAAFLSDVNGSNLQWNSNARGIAPHCDDSTIFDIVFDPSSQNAIQKLCQPADNKTGDPTEMRSIVRLFCQNSEETQMFLAEIVHESFDENESGENLLLLRAVTAAWDQNIARALAAAFLLTPAELDLIESLYRGLTIKEIAKSKKRSQATLRTQLSSVLQKTSTKNQADLSRVVSGLVQILQQGKTQLVSKSKLKNATKPLQQRSQIIQLSSGVDIEVVESGDLDGIPFYFIQPENLPTLTPEIVECLSAKNIRLISPYRPGLGQTTRTSVSISATDWAYCHLEVLQKMDLNPTMIGGHASGGVYAKELAKLAGSTCKCVMLIDTGAPLQTIGMINQMPTSPKRMFLAARYFPIALRSAYKLVTADFYSGVEGEKRLVSYFYEGSPTDEAIINDGDNWQITRENIDYCLQNVEQNIADTTLWSQDTMPLLKEVLSNSRVHYFQGEDNFVHQAENVRQLSNEFSNVTHCIVKGHGQLLIYVEPELFAEEIARLFKLSD